MRSIGGAGAREAHVLDACLVDSAIIVVSDGVDAPRRHLCAKVEVL
jgi:hypothetical protein